MQPIVAPQMERPVGALVVSSGKTLWRNTATSDSGKGAQNKTWIANAEAKLLSIDKSE